MNIQTKINWSIQAKALWEDGMTFFPIDESLVRRARKGFKQFLTRRDEQKDHLDWCLQRLGEHECDLGLICRSGEDCDDKWFLHHDNSLRSHLLRKKLLEDDKDVDFLTTNQTLLDAVNFAGAQLVDALDQLYQLDCAKKYRQCLGDVLPYSTTTLRSLFYADGPEQTGAKAHIDRSFLTIHLGDEGGNLQMLMNGEWQNISPPAGFAVAFFGVKALWVTSGRKQPLRHRSVTFRGHDRFAFVHFGHVPLENYQVQDAQTAYLDWKAENPR